MSEKLNKLGAEREKTRLKRDEWDAKYKDLDRRYKEQENVEIHEMVHAANLTPDQLAVLLRELEHSVPNPEHLNFEEETDHDD